MLKKEDKMIRVRVLVPLTLTFMVLIGTFIYTGYNIRRDAMNHSIEHRYQGIRALFKELQKQRLGLMTATVQYLSHQPVLQDAMIHKNRDALQQLTQPLFAEWNSLHGITHLHFYDTERNALLRVQRPEAFGDQVNRTTLKRAQQTQSLSYGLELGGWGNYALRVVVPWYSANNQLIGYIELGEEISQVLQKLKEITNTDFIVAINKSFIDRAAWEKGMASMNRPADWDQLTSRVVINQTIEHIPPAVGEELYWGYERNARSLTDAEEDKSYQVKAFPLFDVAQIRIGDFVMMMDISHERARFINFMVKTGIFTFVICSALFAFAFRTLGRMDRALVKANNDLYSQIEKAEMLNSKLTVEVAERKRAEKELTALNKTLEKRILERTQKLETLNSEIEANRRELEKAYEDLKVNQATILHQDKMASIGQLAAGVAHDINNPIGFVSNNLSELEQYIKDLCDYMALQSQVIEQLRPDDRQLAMLSEKRSEIHLDEMVDDLDDIIKESLEGTQRVNKIVQNLRRFSRVDEDDYELADIHDCLDSTINISSNELRYRAEVIRDYGDLPKIFCYPGQLNQVFMNMLINAAQSMQDYGQVHIKTWTQANSVFIKFTDTGSGIPEEVQSRIFEPFFTTKDVGTGTGLGLSITYDIIQKHEGDIWVESEVGRGTTFVIRLPIKQQEKGTGQDQDSLC